MVVDHIKGFWLLIADIFYEDTYQMQLILDRSILHKIVCGGGALDNIAQPAVDLLRYWTK